MHLRSALSYVGIVTITLFFGYLLSRAYPYGIIHADTGSYLELGRTFSFFHTNPGDWARTPPFALLLRFSLFTHEPTLTVLWIHVLLFTGNIVLVFWFVLGIFRSRLLAFACTATALALEISLMRTFYYNIHILADPLLAHLILMGSLLTLGGWIRQMPWVLFVGAATLGLAALTKSVGIVLFPVWIPFYIWARGLHKKHAILCLALFLGPIFLWSGRNAVLYGYFQPTAYGGRNILPRVLPLLKDTDIVLDNLQTNRAFIEEVRALEKEVGTEYNHYAWGNVPGRIGYFGILDTLTTEYQETGESLLSLGVKWDVIAINQRFFAIDPLAIRTALRIIRLHPLQYLAMVSDGYFTLFDITYRDFGVSYQLRAPPEETYQGIHNLHEGTRRILYPPSGLPDPTLAAPYARALLAYVARIPSSLRLWFLPSFALLTHAVFLLSIGVLGWRGQTLSPPTTHTAVSIIMLFLTAASHYLLAAATEFPLERYALPGEMGLNLTLLLALFLVLAWLFHAAPTMTHRYYCRCRHHSSNHSSAHR